MSGPTTPPAPPNAKKSDVRKDRGKMIYHLWNAKIPGATNLERFYHAVTVRNRTLGPKAGTEVSPHLDVEVSTDNVKMLRLTPDDVNMYQVLQQSTCKGGV